MEMAGLQVVLRDTGCQCCTVLPALQLGVLKHMGCFGHFHMGLTALQGMQTEDKDCQTLDMPEAWSKDCQYSLHETNTYLNILHLTTIKMINQVETSEATLN